MKKAATTFAAVFAAVVAAQVFTSWMAQPVNRLQTRGECVQSIGPSCLWVAALPRLHY
jgi:hypothetical protein